jgi:hydroxymethylglutaryl-CoA reductase
MLDLADAMIESAVGVTPVPLGVADGFLIDGETVAVPLAVEEPSILAAATFGARILSEEHGILTWFTYPVMTAQVFVEGNSDRVAAAIEHGDEQIRDCLAEPLASITARGGGLRRISTQRMADPPCVKVCIDVDVRDAMGANLLNTAAEIAGRRISEIAGAPVAMAILTNSACARRAGAEFDIDVSSLARTADGETPGADVARRICLASDIAHADSDRAVTHNKGIMNGISGLALATGNDTRAIEAAAHAWAAREGRYTALSTFTTDGERLRGSLELPLPFATVGGAVGMHPASRYALAILGNPTAARLARIAAAVGLVQNFAALNALVTAGIQQGHMRLHAERIAFTAGARDSEIRKVAAALAQTGAFDVETARAVLADIRSRR